MESHSERDSEDAFTKFIAARVDVLLVPPDPVFIDRRDRIIELAAYHAIPTIYPYREDAVAGALISYGSSFATTYRQAGVYAGRILKGAKPADLPVLQPTKFELVINLKTARALGLTPSPGLLASRRGGDRMRRRDVCYWHLADIASLTARCPLLGVKRT